MKLGLDFGDSNILPVRAGSPPAGPIGVAAQKPPSPGEAAPLGLFGYYLVLADNKWKILLMAVLGALAGYLAVLPQTPVYRATTSLEVLDVNSSFLSFKTLDPTVQSYSLETRIHTEMRMLQSPSLVRQVQAKLMQSNAPVQMSQLDPISALLEEYGLPTLRSQVTRASAIRLAVSSLQIRNPDMTRMLEVTCESTDPKTAAQFAEGLIQAYMDGTVEGRIENAQKAREFLDGQLEEVRQKLERSSTQLVEYSRLAGLTLGTESTDRLRKLQEQLSEAQAETLRKKVDVAVAANAESVVPEALQDQELKSLKQELSRKQTELGELRTMFAPEHYRVKRLETQAQALQTRITGLENKAVVRMDAELKRAQLLEGAQAKAYSDQAVIVTDRDRKMIRYSMLQREVETYRQLYDSMLQRVKEGAIAAALRASNVRVVDHAEVPKKPYKPDVSRNVLTGMLTGLFLTVLYVFIRTTPERRFQTPGELSAYLNIRELGSIPSAIGLSSPAHKRKVAGSRYTSIFRPTEKGLSAGASSVELATWAKAPSPLAESFRSALVSLLAGAESKTMTIVVTSPNQHEGKTSVACNLGIALTEVGRRVLLIDGDLRRPRLQEVFRLADGIGLTDLVEGNLALTPYLVASAVNETQVPGLMVLRAGKEVENIARMLYSDRLRTLLGYLQGQFDVILIDTPPMLSYPDARILARIGGGAVVVMRADSTDRETGKQAVARLMEDGVNIHGAILNDWDARKSSHAALYGYSSAR